MQKHPDARVRLSIQAQDMLLEDVCHRRQIEACGVLLGQIDEEGNWHIEQVYPLPNIFNSPVYFEFAPEDLLEVELEYPGQIVGVYHSHPTGLAVASSTDRENMRRVNVEEQIPWVWLIVSGPFSGGGQEDEEQSGCAAVIAYHHYETLGLREITIEFEECKNRNKERE